jgi:hypothetical protein
MLLDDVGVVGAQFGVDAARLDDRDADMLACQFLAQRFAEGADAEFGGAVDGGHGVGVAAGE